MQNVPYIDSVWNKIKMAWLNLVEMKAYCIWMKLVKFVPCHMSAYMELLGSFEYLFLKATWKTKIYFQPTILIFKKMKTV
jgi:hypothetical protein